MPRGRTAHVWNQNDLALQNEYGLHGFNMGTSQPKFGPHILLNLTLGSFDIRVDNKGNVMTDPQGRVDPLSPTMLNLAWHFGYMDKAMQNIASITRKSAGRVSGGDFLDFHKPLQEWAKREFEKDLVHPLRDALLTCQWPLYFYCVSPRTIEVTSVIEEDEETPEESDRVLCVLPTSLEVARYYKVSEEDMPYLAPYVLRVVRLRVGVHKILTSEQFIQAATGWTKYLPRPRAERFLESVQSVNARLLPSGTEQKLLPAGS